MTENARKSKRPRLNLTLNPVSEREKQITDNVLDRLLGADPDDLKEDQIEKDRGLSPVKSTSPVKEDSLAQSMTSPVKSTSPTELTSPVDLTDLKNKNLWDIVEQVNGHLRLPNTYLDSIACQLDPVENTVYLQLFRLSWGYGKDNCMIGIPRLAERCNVGESTIQRALKRLLEKNLIQKVTSQFGKGIEQGSVFRVVIPTSLVNLNSPINSTSPVNLTTIKDLKKKTNINPQNIDIRKLAEIIDQVRDRYRGQQLQISELSDLVKEECANQGVKWDVVLFGQMVR